MFIYLMNLSSHIQKILRKINFICLYEYRLNTSYYNTINYNTIDYHSIIRNNSKNIKSQIFQQE